MGVHSKGRQYVAMLSHCWKKASSWARLAVVGCPREHASCLTNRVAQTHPPNDLYVARATPHSSTLPMHPLKGFITAEDALLQSEWACWRCGAAHWGEPGSMLCWPLNAAPRSFTCSKVRCASSGAKRTSSVRWYVNSPASWNTSSHQLAGWLFRKQAGHA